MTRAARASSSSVVVFGSRSMTCHTICMTFGTVQVAFSASRRAMTVSAIC